MSADQIPQEVHDLLKRAASASAELLVLLTETAANYVSGETPDGESWERVEAIAEQWRDAESCGATLRVLTDESGSTEPLALLGAIQDSLVLSLSDDPAMRELALSTGEVLERVEELRTAGAFDGPVRPYENRDRPERVAAGDVARFEDLSNAVIATHGDNLQLYARLKPDGRELESEEAEAVRERVFETAATARALDVDRKLVAVLEERRDLRADLEVLRATQQGFLLALADDPARRAKAIPVGELGSLWAPVYERWQAETPQG